VNAKLAYVKMIHCTNEAQMKNIGHNLNRIKHKWENEVRKNSKTTMIIKKYVKRIEEI
jgi:hypothetical protein